MLNSPSVKGASRSKSDSGIGRCSAGTGYVVRILLKMTRLWISVLLLFQMQRERYVKIRTSRKRYLVLTNVDSSAGIAFGINYSTCNANEAKAGFEKLQ